MIDIGKKKDSYAIQNDKYRQTAAEIIDVFEDLFVKLNIVIPDSDREGNKDEARIYGSTYYELEDSITKILRERFYGKKR